MGADHDRSVDVDHDFIGTAALRAQVETKARTRVTLVWGQAGASSNLRVEDHVRTEITATVAPAPYFFEDERETTDCTSV